MPTPRKRVVQKKVSTGRKNIPLRDNDGKSAPKRVVTKRKALPKTNVNAKKSRRIQLQEDSEEENYSSSDNSSKGSRSSSASRATSPFEQSERHEAARNLNCQVDTKVSINFLTNMSKSMSNDIKEIKFYLASLFEGKALLNNDLNKMARASPSFLPSRRNEISPCSRMIIVPELCSFEDNKQGSGSDHSEHDSWDRLDDLKQEETPLEFEVARSQSTPNILNEEDQSEKRNKDMKQSSSQ